MATLTVVKSEQLMPGSCFLVATSSAPPCILQQQQAPSNTSATTATAAARLAPKRTRLHTEISNEHDSDLLRCKRRIQFGQIHQQQPAAVARRNERERNRVRLVNLGFATLRQHVPQSAKNKKMSKVDTLRSAVEYIKQLQQLLNEQDSSPTGSSDENTYLGHSYSSSMASTATTSVTSPAYSGASSPTPSVCSDSSSPYDILNGDDDELIDLATWL